MVSPKHLWSGDWEAESAASRGESPTLPAARPTPEQASRPPRTPKPAAPRPRAPKPARPRRRRRRLSAAEMRRWATVGALALIASFIVVSVVNLATRDNPPKHAVVTSAPGLRGASRVTSSAPGAWMGVHMQTWPGGGAVIESVDPGSPAAVSGLAAGDVIIAIDNAPVNSADDVRAALAQLSPGQTVAVQADRGAAGFTAQVTLGSAPNGQSGP